MKGVNFYGPLNHSPPDSTRGPALEGNIIFLIKAKILLKQF